MKKKLTIVNGLLAAAVSLMLFAGCGDDHSTSSVASGKVVQSPVDGAVVFIDSNGNRALDEFEPSTTSDDEGNYTLQIPNGIDGMICTTGGTLIDSGRPALPMLAPRDAKNITPLTTLVAINPGAKSVIGDDWDVDISRAAGVSGKLMQLALAVESFQSSLKSLNSNNISQFSALSFLASNLAGKSLNNDDEVNKAFEETLADLKEAGKELPSTILANISAITAGIDNDSDIVESAAKTAVGAAIPSSPAIAFLPSTDLEEVVMPLPNDIIWQGLEGKLPTEGIEDEQELALYTAVNSLGNEGLSPNTPMSIPLTDDTTLDTDFLASSVKVFNAQKIFETDIAVVQDGKYVKIYPEAPLTPNTQYAVVVLDSLFLDGSQSEKVSKNPLFEVLKSTDPLYDDAASASDTMKTLEQIRGNYKSLFDGLSANSMPRANILTLFTFTTAAKTLSTQDLGKIAQGQEVGDGLLYSNITLDYGALGGTVALRVLGSQFLTGFGQTVPSGIDPMSVDSASTPKTFTSFNISTISETNTDQTFIDEDVPYTVYNGSEYTDTVVIFQHGFTGTKEQAQVFAAKYPDHPVIAMDLPLHGDRDATPDDDSDSGSTYLTPNVAQDRINLYQSFYDMSVLIQGLKDKRFDIDGDDTPDGPTNIYFTGISLGSITGSVVANNNDTSLTREGPKTGLDKVVLNVGGANFAAILDTAKNALFTSLLSELGLEKNSPKYFITMGVLQMLLDPADPAYLAEGLVTKITDTIFQAAYKDTVVSNTATMILGNVAGANDMYYADFSNTHMLPDTVTEASEFTSENAYVFGGAAEKTDNWVTHGFLLDPSIVNDDGSAKYPEAEEYLDADYVSEANSAVIDWTAQYLNN